MTTTRSIDRSPHRQYRGGVVLNNRTQVRPFCRKGYTNIFFRYILRLSLCRQSCVHGKMWDRCDALLVDGTGSLARSFERPSEYRTRTYDRYILSCQHSRAALGNKRIFLYTSNVSFTCRYRAVIEQFSGDSRSGRGTEKGSTQGLAAFILSSNYCLQNPFLAVCVLRTFWLG